MWKMTAVSRSIKQKNVARQKLAVCALRYLVAMMTLLLWCSHQIAVTITVFNGFIQQWENVWRISFEFSANIMIGDMNCLFQKVQQDHQNLQSHKWEC